VAVGLLLAVGYGLPLVIDDRYTLELLFLAHYYAILAASWDFLSGYTGNINFGHAFFIGGAAFLSAIVNLRLGWPPVVTIPLGAAAAAFFGLVVGATTLRLRGPYFAAVTFCFATILYKLSRIAWWVAGGEEGLSGVEPLTSDIRLDYYLALSLMVAATGLLWGLGQSRFGLILRSIGQNEDACQGCGIDTTRYKVRAFVVSAAIAGMAGSMYGHFQMHVGPQMAHDSLSAMVLIMAVVGGMGTIVGPVLGAYVLTLANELLRSIGELRLLIYSLAVILTIFLAPRGLLVIASRLVAAVAPARSGR
jgi:branched-chain amino acid transport system permease protein